MRFKNGKTTKTISVMKKKTILLTFICFLANITNAQNYQGVYSNRTAFFEDANHYITTLQVDSVQLDGNDSILYPMKTLLTKMNGCVNPYDGAFIGKKIKVTNSTTNFLNYQNRYVTLNTQMNLNDSCTVYTSNDTTIRAYVVKHDTLTFLGVTDSVKHLVFKVLKNEILPLEHHLINDTLLLSKHHGLINTKQFYFFPEQGYDMYFINPQCNLSLIGVSNPNLGYQKPTWWDIYDFQVGDEIHIKSSTTDIISTPNSNYTRSIIQKTILSYIERLDKMDTIIYTIDRQYSKSDSTGITIGHDTLFETIHDNPNFDTLIPGKPVLLNGFELTQIDALVGDHMEIYTGSDRAQLYKAEDSCFQEIIVDGYCSNDRYIVGLGGPYYSCMSIFGEGYKKSLAFYKKGSTTWGTPFTISGIEDKEKSPTIAILPNPTTGEFLLQMEQNQLPARFELFTINGQKAYSSIILSNRQQININTLASGMYFYRVSTDGGKVLSGKILKK